MEKTIPMLKDTLVDREKVLADREKLIAEKDKLIGDQYVYIQSLLGIGCATEGIVSRSM